MKIKQGLALLLTLCASITIAVGAQSRTAYAGTVASAPTEVSDAACRPSTTPLSDAEMSKTMAGDEMDAICLVAGICTGFWPLGTLICGPTTLGCVIHYWQQ